MSVVCCSFFMWPENKGTWVRQGNVTGDGKRAFSPIGVALGSLCDKMRGVQRGGGPVWEIVARFSGLFTQFWSRFSALGLQRAMLGQ